MAWTRGDTIGRGSTATVSAATSCSTGEVFAVKTAELSKSEFLQREQKILSTLDGQFVVGYKGYDISTENSKLMFNLMLEFFPEGTLSDEIRRKSGAGGLDESSIRCYARGIVEGLEYLHSNGVVHCDIKGSNILLGKDGPKIADFGCAKWVETPAPVTGTPLFMSPEVARAEDQSFPADIWALGCTVIEMATGGSPWPNATNAESLVYRIAFSGESPEIPEFLSDQAKDFLNKCLNRDPKQRWTAKKLLNHQFLDCPVSKQSQPELKTTSPTCILDQDLWTSIGEEAEVFAADRLQLLCSGSGKPSWDCDEEEGEPWTAVRNRSHGFCPSERVQLLCSGSGLSSWNCEEDEGETWITVRGREFCGSVTDVNGGGLELESMSSGDEENSMDLLDGCSKVKGRSCSSVKIPFSSCTTDCDARVQFFNSIHPNFNQIHCS